MKGDFPDVALRLSQQLPSRVHRAEEHISGKQAKGAVHRPPPRPPTKRDMRPIRIGTSVYASVAHAAAKRHQPQRTIYEWLRVGKAQRFTP